MPNHLTTEFLQAQRARLEEKLGRYHDVERRYAGAPQQLRDHKSRVSLRYVEAALLAMDEGSYGTCASCGDPIPMERLRTVPAAVRCETCETERSADTADPVSDEAVL